MKKYVFITLVCMLLLVGIAAAAEVEATQVGSAVGQASPSGELGAMETLAPNVESGPAIAALATPVLVSPVDYITLYHYPRVTTLSWQPVTQATGYTIIRYYRSGSTWVRLSDVTVQGNLNTVYTWTFIGDQEGAWGVTAFNATSSSAFSGYRYFYYSTKPHIATPVPLQPYNGTLFIGYPRTTTLQWNPVPGAAGYYLERAYCYGGTCTAYTAVTLNGTSYTFSFVGDQWGRWRVTAIPADHSKFYDSTASTWRYFHWNSATAISTPVLTSPASGIYLYNYPRTTTLAWNPVPGATSYQVQVGYYDTTWHTYISTTTTNPYYTFNFVGAQQGEWRVTALGATTPFVNSAWTAWRTFRYMH
jgi:hypothetical protein